MSDVKTILITGANAGLGKECARQLALLPDTAKIILGCRNAERAEAAKESLEQSTGREIFDILILDLSDLDSVRRAAVDAPVVDAVVLNAGGSGGSDGHVLTEAGVTWQFAVNVLGHAALTEALLEADKVRSVVIYAGSEAARGVPEFKMAQPSLPTSSVAEFVSICDGSFFGEPFDEIAAYAHAKYVAAMWMSSLARKYPAVRLVTMSPGGTAGTNAVAAMPPLKRFLMSYVGMPLMRVFGHAHNVEAGAKRYLDALMDERYATGVFYGNEKKTVGPLADQAVFFPDLRNPAFQDNARAAIHRFID
jgi:NAD(P)-dependent dehydrogenase (short-subunit alcohol dehydrogenase family)